MIKGLILDLDDTLGPAETSYSEAMKLVGIDPQDPHFTLARKLTKDQLPDGSPSARSRFLYFKKYLELKNEYGFSRHLELAHHYEKHVIRLMHADWKIKSRDIFFEKIFEKNIALCILTNETLRFQVNKLSVLFENFGQEFQLITSEEFGIEKPRPKLFQEALRRLNLDPANILGVGDSFKNDIEGFLHAEIPCVQTLEYRQDSQTYAHTINKLDEVLNLIEAS